MVHFVGAAHPHVQAHPGHGHGAGAGAGAADVASGSGSTYGPGESSRGSTSNGESYTVPRLGVVRCYWALLRPRYTDNGRLDLQFVHMDPVLGAHLAKQRMSLMGRGIMEFIHPHEREQARRDLTSAIAANDLQGSVTRVRFARLSRIKMILGCPPEEELDLPDQINLVVEDEDYLILDVVINWAADGLLLAFFHAIKDMDAAANNDPARIHEGWSNFCSTPHLGDESIQAMSEGLSLTIPLPSPSRLPPTRVFQLYSSPPSRLLYSWPPPRPPGDPGQLDGSYNAEEYIELLSGVNMDPSVLPHTPGEVRTTCSTRFGAKHSMTSEGVYRLVESVFVPYGDIVFACFQTTKVFELSPRSGTGLGEHAHGLHQHQSGVGMGMGQQYEQAQKGQMAPAGMGMRPGTGTGVGLARDRSRTPTIITTPGYRPSESPLRTPKGQGMYPPPLTSAPLLTGHSSSSNASPSHLSSTYDEQPRIRHDGAHVDPYGQAVGDRREGEDPEHPRYPHSTYSTDNTHPYAAPPPPLHPASKAQADRTLQPPLTGAPHPLADAPNGEAFTRSYPLLSLPPPNGMAVSALSSGPISDPHHQPRHPLPVPLVLQPPHPQANGHSHSHSLSHPPPPHLLLPMHPPPMDDSPPHHGYSGSAHGIGHSGAHAHGHGHGPGHGASTRPLIRPPDGIECCVMCGTRESPEWRRNESGIKDLCNACGLRLARQINKRNGKQKPRKKKTSTAAV